MGNKWGYYNWNASILVCGEKHGGSIGDLCQSENHYSCNNFSDLIACGVSHSCSAITAPKQCYQVQLPSVWSQKFWHEHTIY